MLQTFFNIPEKREKAFFDTEGSEIEGDEEYNIFEERDRTMVDVRHQLKRMHKTKYARWKEKAQTGFEQVKKGKPRVKEFNEKRRDLWLDQRRLDQLYSLLGQHVKPSLVPKYIEKILDIEKFIRAYHNEIIESPLTEFRPYIHCVDALRIISLTHETNILYDIYCEYKKFLFASRFLMIDEMSSINDLNIFCLPKQRKFKNNFRIMQHIYTGDRRYVDRRNNNPEDVYCDDFIKIDGRSGFIYKYDNLDAINMNKNRIKRKKAQEHINIVESFLENFEPGDWKNRSSKQAGKLMLNLSRQEWFDKLSGLCIKAIDMLFAMLQVYAHIAETPFELSGLDYYEYIGCSKIANTVNDIKKNGMLYNVTFSQKKFNKDAHLTVPFISVQDLMILIKLAIPLCAISDSIIDNIYENNFVKQYKDPGLKMLTKASMPETEIAHVCKLLCA